MVARVLIIGAYGNFGSYIARSLAGDAGIRLLIGGRSVQKAQTFAASLNAAHPAKAHMLFIEGVTFLLPSKLTALFSHYEYQADRTLRSPRGQRCHSNMINDDKCLSGWPN